MLRAEVAAALRERAHDVVAGNRQVDEGHLRQYRAHALRRQPARDDHVVGVHVLSGDLVDGHYPYLHIYVAPARVAAEDVFNGIAELGVGGDEQYAHSALSFAAGCDAVLLMRRYYNSATTLSIKRNSRVHET